jgi:predicted RNase H-like HicB family nuclease
MSLCHTCAAETKALADGCKWESALVERVAFEPDRRYVEYVFTAVFQKSGDWWAAYVEEVPGVNTQGATLEEARENLREAFAMVLEANRELARREETADCIRETLALET